MNLRNFLILCISSMLTACVQTPNFKAEGFAILKSNYPIINVNGEQIEPAYQLDIVAGDISVVIVYQTYQNNYFCRFNWNARPATVYEVTDQEHKYPLTLYRWVATNRLWASRLDAIEPTECKKAEED